MFVAYIEFAVRHDMVEPFMMVVVFLLTFGFVSLYSSLSLIFMNVFLYAYGYYVVAYTSDKGFKEIRALQC